MPGGGGFDNQPCVWGDWVIGAGDGRGVVPVVRVVGVVWGGSLVGLSVVLVIVEVLVAVAVVIAVEVGVRAGIRWVDVLGPHGVKAVEGPVTCGGGLVIRPMVEGAEPFFERVGDQSATTTTLITGVWSLGVTASRHSTRVLDSTQLTRAILTLTY